MCHNLSGCPRLSGCILQGLVCWIIPKQVCKETARRDQEETRFNLVERNYSLGKEPTPNIVTLVHLQGQSPLSLITLNQASSPNTTGS